MRRALLDRNKLDSTGDASRTTTNIFKLIKRNCRGIRSRNKSFKHELWARYGSCYYKMHKIQS